MKTACLAFAALTALGFTGAAAAQTVWRCGADGRAYADSPCPGGRAVAVADARRSDEVAAAREVLARDRALVRELVAERHEREREYAARGLGAAGIGAPAAAPLKPAAKPKKARPQKPLRLAARRTSPSAVLASR